MSCHDACLSTMEYEGGNEFYSERYRRAAKPHKCCECGDAIPVGTEYQRATSKSDGTLWSFATCVACANVRQTFACGGWVFGQLWEAVREEMFPYWEDNLMGVECLAKLTTDEAVAKMRAEYATYREDHADAP